MNVSQLVFGLCPSVKLDVYFPGFPTLKHVSHEVRERGGEGGRGRERGRKGRERGRERKREGRRERGRG